MSQRILVIDDETNIRTMIRLTLEHSGYAVDIAEDGEKGLAAFKKDPTYDLVLVDYRMPGMSGTDVQTAIQKVSPKTHVIIITAYGTIDLAMDAIHAGASDFLRKPFTADTLRQTVKRALETAKTSGLAVPIDKVCKPFTRTNINGFSLQVDEDATHRDTDDGSVHAHFIVHRGDTIHQKVTVLLETYVIELAKAHLDVEVVPGGESFWRALCEEALADHLWREAQVPPDGELHIQDLSRDLERWLDSVSTVDTYVQS